MLCLQLVPELLPSFGSLWAGHTPHAVCDALGNNLPFYVPSNRELFLLWRWLGTACPPPARSSPTPRTVLKQQLAAARLGCRAWCFRARGACGDPWQLLQLRSLHHCTRGTLP